MSQAETGAYIRLLCQQWNRGSLPVQPELLQRLAGGEITEAVLEKFPISSDGNRRNARLEIEREKQAQYREKQRLKGVASGNARRTAVKPRLKSGSRSVGTGSEPEGNSSSSSSSSVQKVQNSASPPPTTHHVAFIDGWTQNFRKAFGFDYQFDGGRDGKAVKDLLRMQIQSIDLLEIAKEAWERGARAPKSFVCQKATTIHGFRDHLNEIRMELKHGNRPHQRINQRLVGVSQNNAVNNYAEAAKRKLERQTLEAQNGPPSQTPGA